LSGRASALGDLVGCPVDHQIDVGVFLVAGLDRAVAGIHLDALGGRAAQVADGDVVARSGGRLEIPVLDAGGGQRERHQVVPREDHVAVAVGAQRVGLGAAARVADDQHGIGFAGANVGIGAGARLPVEQVVALAPVVDILAAGLLRKWLIARTLLEP
jgi:hypothetical protein